MDFETPAIYGLDLPSRALASLNGESELIEFIVGTQSVRSENQIHLLNYNDEDNALDSRVFSHPAGEIWHLNTHLTQRDLFACTYGKVVDQKVVRKTALYRLALEPPEEVSRTSHEALKTVGELSDNGFQTESTVWHPTAANKMLTSGRRSVHLWDVDANTGTSQPSEGFTVPAGEANIAASKFNPHQNSMLVVSAVGYGFRGWDTRTKETSFKEVNAHDGFIRDLDFNPNKQYYMATCSHDCSVKFWDIRNTTKAVLEFKSHTHWVWNVRYNSFHDQLVLSSSSDGLVALYCAASISSDMYGGAGDRDTSNTAEDEEVAALKDGLVSTFEEHEDSVYSCAWSTTDPWTFASVSYDGRFIINHVPRDTKYKILL